MRKSLWFQSICHLNGLSVTEQQLELLERYVGLLLEWNKRVNLISRRDEENIWERHILHSVSLLFHLSFNEPSTLMDLGTGGGLPGIPLKIMSPGFSVTLVDSIKKKTAVVNTILQELSLPNVAVEFGRAEDLAKRTKFQNQFEYVLARGVATLKELVEWSYPFFRVRKAHLTQPPREDQKKFIEPPALIGMKGGDLRAEIRLATRRQYVGEVTVVDLVINGLETTRRWDKKAVIVHFK